MCLFMSPFTTSDSTRHITLGAESTHIKGRYAQLEDATDTLVMSYSDYSKIFLSAIELFDSILVSVDDDDEIIYVEMKQGDSSLILDLGDIAWEAIVDEDTFEPKQVALDALLTAISEAEADDVALDAPATPAESVGSLLIKSDKGREWKLDLAKADENTYSVSLNGSTSTYTIDQELFDKLFPALDTFRSADGEETIDFQPPALILDPADDGHDHEH